LTHLLATALLSHNLSGHAEASRETDSQQPVPFTDRPHRTQNPSFLSKKEDNMMIRRRIIPIVLVAGTATGALMAPVVADAAPTKICSTTTTTNNNGGGKGITTTTTQTQTSACGSNSDTGSTTTSTSTNPAGHTPGG
jgi:hypothetical protein